MQIFALLHIMFFIQSIYFPLVIITLLILYLLSFYSWLVAYDSTTILWSTKFSTMWSKETTWNDPSEIRFEAISRRLLTSIYFRHVEYCDELSRILSQSAFIVTNGTQFFHVSKPHHIHHKHTMWKATFCLSLLKWKKFTETFRFLYKPNISLYNVKIEHLNIFNA